MLLVIRWWRSTMNESLLPKECRTCLEFWMRQFFHFLYLCVIDFYCKCISLYTFNFYVLIVTNWACYSNSIMHTWYIYCVTKHIIMEVCEKQIVVLLNLEKHMHIPHPAPPHLPSSGYGHYALFMGCWLHFYFHYCLKLVPFWTTIICVFFFSFSSTVLDFLYVNHYIGIEFSIQRLVQQYVNRDHFH